MSAKKPLIDLLVKKDWQKLGIDHAVFTTCGFYFPRVVGHLLAKKEGPGQQRDSNQLPNPKTDQSCVLFCNQCSVRIAEVNLQTICCDSNCRWFAFLVVHTLGCWSQNHVGLQLSEVSTTQSKHEALLWRNTDTFQQFHVLGVPDQGPVPTPVSKSESHCILFQKSWSPKETDCDWIWMILS